MLIAIILSAIFAVVVTAMPDQYHSSARVYIDSDVVLKPLLRGLTVEGDPENQARMLRVFQRTILNEDNIDRLVKAQGMGFDAKTAQGRSVAARTIRSGVKIGSEIGSEVENLFTVDYTDSDPVRARNVVQGLLSIFIETNIGQSRSDLDGASKFLEMQIAEYEVKVRNVEAQLSEFRTRNIEVLGEPNYQTRLRAALTVLRDAQLAKQTALQLRNQIQTKIASSRASGHAGAVLGATDPTFPTALARLQALQNQLSVQLLVYTDKHPDVQATRRDIGLLTQQYGLDVGEAATKPFVALPGQVTPDVAATNAVTQATAAVSATAGGGAQQVSNSRQMTGVQMQLLQANFGVMDSERKVTDAEAALQAIEKYSSTAPAAEIGLEQLTRDYALLKENYEQLIRRRESARITQAAGVSSGAEKFRILEAPSLPRSPTGPDRRFFLLLGALLAVSGGAGFAYSIGLMKGTFVSAAEAEQALGLPVIAQITNSQGVLTRVSRYADAAVLSAGVAAIFIAALILSATAGFLVPLRSAIYGFLEGDLGQQVLSLF